MVVPSLILAVLKNIKYWRQNNQFVKRERFGQLCRLTAVLRDLRFVFKLVLNSIGLLMMMMMMMILLCCFIVYCSAFHASVLLGFENPVGSLQYRRDGWGSHVVSRRV
jgi:hypothetical protein